RCGYYVNPTASLPGCLGRLAKEPSRGAHQKPPDLRPRPEVEAVRVPSNPSGACQVWDCNKALRYRKKLHVRQRRPFTATHLNLDSVAEKRVAILRLFLLAPKRPALSKPSGGARRSTARSAISQSARC